SASTRFIHDINLARQDNANHRIIGTPWTRSAPSEAPSTFNVEITMSAILPVPARLVRSFTFFFGLIALAAFPGVLAADDGCGCWETCRQAYGGMRYAKEP